MVITGVVAEYNPFHNGHRLHLEVSREKTKADKIIVVMSGNFVQRGEPSIYNKWVRAKAALINGADMVIELPTLFSTATAEVFATASVKLLAELGIIDYISFGSELGDINELKKISTILCNEDNDYILNLKKFLKDGLSFPKSRSIALKNVHNIDMETMSNPNNILGIEYLKAIERLNLSIEPVTIKRMYTDYNDKNTINNFCSATALREIILNDGIKLGKNFMPTALEGEYPVFPDLISEFLTYRLLTMTNYEIKEISQINEGIENRILKAIEEYRLFSDIVEFVKTKRYPKTRIQRVLLNIVLNIKERDLVYAKNRGYCPYIRVLGVKKESIELLSIISNSSSLPLVTNYKSRDNLDSYGIHLLERERVFTDIYYGLNKSDTFVKLNMDIKRPMVII